MTDGHVGQGDVPTLPPVLNNQEEVQLRRQNEEMRWTLKKTLVQESRLSINVGGQHCWCCEKPFDQAGWLEEVA